MVVEADNPSDLPYSIFVLPEVNELCLAHRFCGLLSRVVEAVNADLHRAIVRDGIYLKCSWHEFPGYFAADVVLYAVHSGLSSASETTYIVIELKIVRQQRPEFFQIAVVIGVKELRV